MRKWSANIQCGKPEMLAMQLASALYSVKPQFTAEVVGSGCSEASRCLTIPGSQEQSSAFLPGHRRHMRVFLCLPQ